MRRIVMKIAIVAVSVVMALLLAEGLYSLMTGGSLARLDVGVQAARVLERDDAERARTAELTPGPFALDVDPVVGLRMKSSTTREIAGVAATTDAWGQRVRRGPPPEEGAQRIVVLGDSVAFGFGVADDETYGHRLEEVLREAVVDGPEPVVFTVACPGWNGVGALRYLHGHLDRLAPDLVVYLPTRNDLDDVGTVDEAGYLSRFFSPLMEPGRPFMSVPTYFDRAAWMGGRLSTARQLEIATAGGRWWETLRYALYSRMGSTSELRWERFHEALDDIAARLERRGAGMVAALRWDSAFFRDLELDLRTRSDGAPAIIPMFDEERPEDGLEKDTHPNAECIRAGAVVIARHLVEADLVERADRARLPAAVPAYADRERPPFTTDELAAWREELRRRNTRFCGDVIDVEAGVGFHQVYGGLDEDGWIGRCASFLMPGRAQRITATYRLEDESTAPLPVEVEIVGPSGSSGFVGTVFQASVGRDQTASWDVPADLRSAPFIDVHVRTKNWAVESVEGTMKTRAFRLLRLRSER